MYQICFGFNVWCRILVSRLIGTIIFRLTSEVYLDEILDEIPLPEIGGMVSQMKFNYLNMNSECSEQMDENLRICELDCWI